MDDKYMKEIIDETIKTMSWARQAAKTAPERTPLRRKYTKYYKLSRIELAGLYLMQGRVVNLTGYETHIPLIRESYESYRKLIETNKKLMETTTWPEQVSVRLKKYRYIRKGLKLLYEKLQEEEILRS